jgi:hypothetical protein
MIYKRKVSIRKEEKTGADNNEKTDSDASRERLILRNVVESH